jgi:hypothetical protein
VTLSFHGEVVSFLVNFESGTEPELEMGRGDQPSSFSIGGTNIDFFFPELNFFIFFFFFSGFFGGGGISVIFTV